MTGYKKEKELGSQTVELMENEKAEQLDGLMDHKKAVSRGRKEVVCLDHEMGFELVLVLAVESVASRVPCWVA
jgi:hypothetical protein